ncbi:MAG: hypothetical protein K9I95_05255 [Flavobacteriaceae bacterium]|jgi:hypothetical protein|nr:hypothetical protein [Flavobacteriaceae bacterium]
MKDFFSNPYVIGIIIAFLNVVFRKYLEPILPNGKTIISEIKPFGLRILSYLNKLKNYILGYVVPVYTLCYFFMGLYKESLEFKIVWSILIIIIMIFIITANLILDLKEYRRNVR